MKRLLNLLLVIVMVIAFGYPVSAKEQPAQFQGTITVAENGGKYTVGFVTVEFKKDFLQLDSPTTFEARVYAENGLAYIEFSPDTPDFYKKVHIKVDAYEGLIYDRTLGKNIEIDIKHNQILAEHFSRYCLCR